MSDFRFCDQFDWWAPRETHRVCTCGQLICNGVPDLREDAPWPPDWLARLELALWCAIRDWIYATGAAGPLAMDVQETMGSWWPRLALEGFA